jgi:hypothetical protein
MNNQPICSLWLVRVGWMSEVAVDLWYFNACGCIFSIPNPDPTRAEATVAQLEASVAACT